MDNSILKKRLNTFKSAKGTLRKVSDDVVIDVLVFDPSKEKPFRMSAKNCHFIKFISAKFPRRSGSCREKSSG